MPGTYSFTSDDRAAFTRVKGLVRDHPGIFKDAGELLDARYSDRGIRRFEAAQRCRWWKAGRTARRESVDSFSVTSAALRKLYGADKARSLQDAHRRKRVRHDGKWCRTARPVAERFREAFRDTASATKDNPNHDRVGHPLDDLVASERIALAKRIILITWLLTDPDAHEFYPVLTHFQRLLWESRWGQDRRGSGVMWVSEAEEAEMPQPRLIDGAFEAKYDFLTGRHSLQRGTLKSDWLAQAWFPRLTEAIRVIQTEVLNGRGGDLLVYQPDSITGPKKTMNVTPSPFAGMALRLRSLVQQQPRPTDRQAGDEINALCAQGIRCYKQYADAGVAGFEPDLVRLTLTGNGRQDQARLLTNDHGHSRWLDIVQSVSGQFSGRIAPDPGAPEYILQPRPPIISTTSGPGYNWAEGQVTIKTYPLANWPQRAREYADVLDCLNEMAETRQVSIGDVEMDSKPTHSPDFTSVNWFGTRHTFSKGNQAQAVRALWEAWEGGEHSLSQETIGMRIESSADRFEMRKTFRRRKLKGSGYEPHPAWGTMIQQDGKGCFRLVRPNLTDPLKIRE